MARPRKFHPPATEMRLMLYPEQHEWLAKVGHDLSKIQKRRVSKNTLLRMLVRNAMVIGRVEVVPERTLVEPS